MAAAPASIQITVDRPEHLFNALDPAPLIGRDLDEKIERYVVHLARETDARGYAMTIHLSEVPSENLDEFGKAIGVFFAHRRDEEAQKLRLLLREGRHALAIGLAFLSLCVFFGLVSLRTIPEPFGFLLDEGLLIVGSVANWRPIEIFLYDWRPIRSQRNMFDPLARMPVSFQAVPSLG